MIAKIKPIAPSQSKSPASVPRLAEMSGSILLYMIGLLVSSTCMRPIGPRCAYGEAAPIPAVRGTEIERLASVESRCGAVAVG